MAFKPIVKVRQALLLVVGLVLGTALGWTPVKAQFNPVLFIGEAIAGGSTGRVLYVNGSVLGQLPGILSTTAGQTYTFPTTTATLARTNAGQTFTGAQIITEPVGSSGLTITGATQTSSVPALNISQTWNASGTTFNGLNLNVTKTAAANASSFGTFQIGGTTSTLLGIPGTNSGVNSYPTFRQVEVINGVDKLSLSADNQFHATIATNNSLAIVSPGGISIDGAGAGAAAPNLTQNGLNISRNFVSFSRHSTATGTTPAYGRANVGIEIHQADDNTSTLALYSQSAFATAVTNITGGPVTITGGSGASSSAGAASGGDVSLIGGIGYGTGHQGYLYINTGLAQLGVDVNGTATAPILQAANGITGTDKAGANFTIRPGAGTGAAAISALIFQSPTLGSTGTTAQTQTTRFTIDQTSARATVPVTGLYLQATTVYSAAGTALPTCNGAAEGAIAPVSDATLPTFLTAYTSGGAVHALVYCDGTSWKTV